MAMKLIDMNKIEVNKFVEYIQNYIVETLAVYNEKCASKIEQLILGKSWNSLSLNDLNNIINSQVVQPYTLFVESFIIDLNTKFREYFEFEQDEIINSSYKCYVYNYNGELFKEYDNTRKLSKLMENFIDKAFDLNCLEHINSPLLKRFMAPLSVGELLLSSFGADNSFLMKRNKQEVSKVIKGINKNMNIRIKNLLIKQYTEYIYSVMEEIEDFTNYEQVI